jgi:hypothetical protein
MPKILIAMIMVISTSAMAMGSDYKKMPNGGYAYTGGSHIKGCSNQFQVGSTSKQFVIDCMKIDSLGVKTPDRQRTITDRYGRRDIITYGITTFYFQNGILDGILN